MEAPRPGTASPRKIFALARCTQHDKATYHLRVSSDGSSSKCAALRCASLRMSAAVSLAMKPCRSNASARKSKGCSRRPVLRSNTGWSRFFRRAHSSATLPALFSQPRYVLGFARGSHCRARAPAGPSGPPPLEPKPTKMARKKSTLRVTRTTTDKLPTYITDTDLR